MPLVMLCGQPSSGKSTLAAHLAQLFQEAGHTPVIVDESILHMDKSFAHAGLLLRRLLAWPNSKSPSCSFLNISMAS